MTKNLAPETVAAQAGGAMDEETGGIVPPLHLTTTFVRDPDNQYRKGYIYGRADNATVRQVENVLTQLEGGAGSLVLASGMSAATTAFLALERPAHVVAPNVMYWGLRKWLLEDAPSLGIEASFVDAADPAAIRAAVRPGRTRMVWTETPANPLWTITDIEEAARIAHAAGAVLARRLHGADARADEPDRARRRRRHALGHQISERPFGRGGGRAGVRRARARTSSAPRARAPCWAPSSARSRRRCCCAACAPCTCACGISALSAMTIAQHFARHPRVEAVLYPGLATHPGHAIAARQMRGGFGGMLSVRVKGGEAAAIATAANVKLWKRATSLGGVESLIEHRASIEGPGSPCPPDLLRLSVGLESTDDLIGDLEQAMGAG